jgi:hypothetical protein
MGTIKFEACAGNGVGNHFDQADHVGEPRGSL